MQNYDDFYWAWKLLQTHAFGKYTPSTALVPIAELLNHENVYTYYTFSSSDDPLENIRDYNFLEIDED